MEYNSCLNNLYSDADRQKLIAKLPELYNEILSFPSYQIRDIVNTTFRHRNEQFQTVNCNLFKERLTIAVNTIINTFGIQKWWHCICDAIESAKGPALLLNLAFAPPFGLRS